MQRVFLPFQLSGTSSYKLKRRFSYRVSLSILGNMHNIGNTVQKEKKKKKERERKKRKGKKEKGEARRQGKMHTARATLLLKKAFVQSPH